MAIEIREYKIVYLQGDIEVVSGNAGKTFQRRVMVSNLSDAIWAC